MLRLGRGSYALLIVIQAVAAVIVWMSWRGADRALRADILRRAELVAETVGVQQVRALGGEEADTTNPVYQRLKRQLAVARESDRQCRFLYLLGRRAQATEGPSFFFHLDSEPAESPDYSPPGQSYDEAPPECRIAFVRRTPVVAGRIVTAGANGSPRWCRSSIGSQSHKPGSPRRMYKLPWAWRSNPFG